MTIPSTFAGHIAAAHCLEARINIFKNTGPNMVKAGASIGGRGAFIENPWLTVGTKSSNFVNNVMVPPCGKTPSFQRWEIEFWLNGTEWHRG